MNPANQHPPPSGHPSQEGIKAAANPAPAAGSNSPLERGGAERRGVLRRRILPYNPRLIPLARALRNQSTLAEVLLWKHLSRGQRHGFDFHRQKPILEWIADFFCVDLGLVIELDGDSHRFKADDDRLKEAAFRELGLTVLRFGDTEVKRDIAGVVSRIDAWIADCARGHTPPSGHPSREGNQADANAAQPGGSSSPLERGGAERRGV